MKNTRRKNCDPMNRTSNRHRSRNRAHAKCRAEYLAGKPCAVCRKVPATEVHHIAGRNASARNAIAECYEDLRNWLPVCGSFQNNCHERIDKESPAMWSCAAKMQMAELDLSFLRRIRMGRRFSFTLAELEQAADDLEAWRLLL